MGDVLTCDTLVVGGGPAGAATAIVLASAAVHRLGLEGKVAQFFPEEDLVPAVGQGALAVETRAGDEAVIEMVKSLDHEDSRLCVEAERAFMRRLEGGCQVPAAAYATRQGAELELHGMVAALDGEVIFRERLRGPALDGGTLGQELAERILERGGANLLASLGIHGAGGSVTGQVAGVEPV